MCGIIGYQTKSDSTVDIDPLIQAIESISHRGPDDRGIVLANREGKMLNAKSQVFPHFLALGHVRFSLVDLTDAGHQPFISEDERIVLIFNGEIYNYVELKQELILKGFVFNTQSDTEVFMRAYEHWGVDCFSKFVGFWACVIYDKAIGKVLLARDRIGQAPLYYCRKNDSLVWASEIKGILSLIPEEKNNINEDAVFYFANWLKRDFADSTFYQNIKSFPKASYAWIEEDGSFTCEKYWHLPETRLTEQEISIEEAISQFRTLIDEATRIRLRLDAPAALQLSGGMDSSTLLASAVKFCDRVEVYTVKYGEGDLDEEPFANMVAKMYSQQVNYHVVKPLNQNFLDEIPAYASHMDEPFHSPNQISSQYIWRQMKKKSIRAAIYGAGGDEVFAGYGSEYYAPHLTSFLRQGKFSPFIKDFYSYSEYPEKLSLKDYAIMIAKMIPGVPRKATLGQIHFVKQFMNPLCETMQSRPVFSPPSEINARIKANMEDWRMNYWLRVDNLNSMMLPIELRTPFLDHRVIEYAFTLPTTYLIRDGWLKWIIRQSMEKQLPSEIVWRRKKMGFPFPLYQWQKDNKGFFQDLLLKTDCPYVDSAKLFKHFDRINSQHTEYLWALISILLWWKYNI